MSGVTEVTAVTKFDRQKISKEVDDAWKKHLKAKAEAELKAKLANLAKKEEPRIMRTETITTTHHTPTPSGVWVVSGEPGFYFGNPTRYGSISSRRSNPVYCAVNGKCRHSDENCSRLASSNTYRTYKSWQAAKSDGYTETCDRC